MLRHPPRDDVGGGLLRKGFTDHSVKNFTSPEHTDLVCVVNAKTKEKTSEKRPAHRGHRHPRGRPDLFRTQPAPSGLSSGRVSSLLDGERSGSEGNGQRAG